jgi:hypothetical protein
MVILKTKFSSIYLLQIYTDNINFSEVHVLGQVKAGWGNAFNFTHTAFPHMSRPHHAVITVLVSSQVNSNGHGQSLDG